MSGIVANLHDSPSMWQVSLPGVSSSTVNMQVAAQRAAAMAAALSGGVPGKDPTKPHYEAELEINDFPQHSRWKVGYAHVHHEQPDPAWHVLHPHCATPLTGTFGSNR